MQAQHLQLSPSMRDIAQACEDHSSGHGCDCSVICHMESLTLTYQQYRE